MTSADKPRGSRVEYLDRDQIQALRKKESEARKRHQAGEDMRGDRIMSALDKLGQRLVQSESERMSLKAIIDQAKEQQAELKQELDATREKQQALESQMRGVKQQNNRLNRKLDNQDQARARIQRRMQRIELMASDAQEALESRAMVLLTDQTLAQRSGLPYARADEPLPLAPYEDSHHTQAEDHPSWWQKPLRLSVTGLLFTGLCAVGLGLLIAKAIQPNNSAFAVLQDGTLARIDLRTGDIQPIRIQAEEIKTPGGRQFASTNIEPHISVQARVAENISSEPGDINRGVQLALQTTEQLPLTDQMIEDGTLKDDLKFLEKQAYDAVPEAQHDLAALYTAGQGVTQDYERAAFWFTQAANNGIANAAYNLGVLHHQGLGVSKDIPLALDWYRRAALLGHAEAEYNLGIAYIEGIGTLYNPKMAAAFFQHAALNGIMEAAYNLGLILENELLVGTRVADAMVWYRTAMERGSAEARTALTALAESEGVPFDKAGRLDDGKSFAELMEMKKQGLDGINYPDSVTLTSLLPTPEDMIVIQIQELLVRARLYTGATDGVVSEALRQAISEYKDNQDIADTDLTLDEFLSFALTLHSLNPQPDL